METLTVECMQETLPKGKFCMQKNWLQRYGTNGRTISKRRLGKLLTFRVILRGMYTVQELLPPQNSLHSFSELTALSE